MSGSGALLSVILACAPSVAPSTIQSIIDVESKGNVLAIGVNRGGRLQRQPANYAEATAWARWLLANGKNFDAGLMQVNSANWKRLGLTPENVFDPCTNIRAGAKILTDNYLNAAKTHGPGRKALLAAVSAYNTGNQSAGFRNGYVGKVNTAAAKLAGVAPPVIEAPARVAIAARSPKPTPRAPAPVAGGVAPAASWRGGIVWGEPSKAMATTTTPSPTTAKEIAE